MAGAGGGNVPPFHVYPPGCAVCCIRTHLEHEKRCRGGHPSGPALPPGAGGMPERGGPAGADDEPAGDGHAFLRVQGEDRPDRRML